MNSGFFLKFLNHTKSKQGYNKDPKDEMRDEGFPPLPFHEY